jgi:hypothetical protein
MAGLLSAINDDWNSGAKCLEQDQARLLGLRRSQNFELQFHTSTLDIIYTIDLEEIRSARNSTKDTAFPRQGMCVLRTPPNNHAGLRSIFKYIIHSFQFQRRTFVVAMCTDAECYSFCFCTLRQAGRCIGGQREPEVRFAANKK